MTRREYRQPTRRERAQLTSSRPVVRRAIRTEPLCNGGTPMSGEGPDATPRGERNPTDCARAPLFYPPK